MAIDRRILAGALGLALVVAACGGSSSTPSPAPGATQAPESTPAPTAALTSAPTEEATGPDASFSEGQAGDLEAMLPDEAGGIKFKKQSFDGASIGASGMEMDTGELSPILKANGKSIGDVRMAIAQPAVPSATATAVIIAFQIKGVDATQFIPLLTASSTDPLTPATVGGKQVQQMGSSGFQTVIYTKGDVLFEVIGATAATIEAIVAALP